MKSLFYLSLMAAGMLAVHANGQSLYTLAGPVGLEESLPLKWTFNLAGGYDDNVNASNYDQQEAAFISTDIGASLSNGMMDIARHGIYQPEHFYFAEIMCILLAVMLTDVVLLDVFLSLIHI